MKTFTAIDFETADKHHICSVGIVTVENGKIIDEYQTFIQPHTIYKAIKVNNYSLYSIEKY